VVDEESFVGTASRWYFDIIDAIEEIGQQPTRYALSANSDRFPVEIREMLYRPGRRPTRRVHFTIRPDSIYVLAVRHVSQDAFSPDDL